MVQRVVDSMLSPEDIDGGGVVHVVLTGHSLGAAMASLCAIDLTDHYRQSLDKKDRVHVSAVG